MAIDPLKTGSPSPDTGATRARSLEEVRRAPAAGADRDASAAGTSADSLALSPEARALVGAGPVGATDSSLAPERLRELIDRIASGFYDTAAVRDVVAQRVASDLGLAARE